MSCHVSVTFDPALQRLVMSLEWESHVVVVDLSISRIYMATMNFCHLEKMLLRAVVLRAVLSFHAKLITSCETAGHISPSTVAACGGHARCLQQDERFTPFLVIN
jgi:hypothetical protein